MNKFLEWVENYGGAPRLAESLGITPHAIRYWLRGDSTPTVSMVVRILKLSKNKVTFQDIVSVKKQIITKTRAK